MARSRACLALPPALSPSTRKISVPSAASRRAVGQLAGQAQLAGRGLARDFLFLPLLQPVFGLIDHEIQQPVGFCRAFRQPMIEMIAHHVFHQALGVGRGKLVLGLALEFRLADEDRQHGAGAVHHIVGGDEAGLAIVGALAMGAQRLGQGIAQALFMRAALRRGNGVAIGADEGIDRRRPGHRPFHRARCRRGFRCGRRSRAA